MIYTWISMVCLGGGFWVLAGVEDWRAWLGGARVELEGLREASAVLVEWEGWLQSARLPPPEAWERIARLRAPWGGLSHACLARLRTRGAPLLPTLKRLRGLAEEHSALIQDSRARAAQALGQSILCAGLVPLWGVVLWLWMPGLDRHGLVWGGGCAVALGLAASGSFWLLKLADSARWAGLPTSERAWVLASACAGERFLAQVRSGSPPDLAWNETLTELQNQAPQLAAAWGVSLWSPSVPSERGRSQAAKALAGLGHDLRKSIQVASMEGSPCQDRVESLLSTARSSFRAQTDRELALLANRALKPLFLCVAPALLSLLALAFALAGWDLIRDLS